MGCPLTAERRFKPRTINVGYVVYSWNWDMFLSQYCAFPSQYYSTSFPYSVINHQHYMNSALFNTIHKNWISGGIPKRVRDIPVNEG